MQPPDTPQQDDLVPIDEAARQLGLRASAIRYYEQRGLIQPAARRAGRRCYDQTGLRRLAIIRYWQRSGLMDLDRIADILDGSGDRRRWSQIVEEQLTLLARQIEQMHHAHEHLQHLLEHHRDASPDGCAHYETFIWQPEHIGRHPDHWEASEQTR